MHAHTHLSNEYTYTYTRLRTRARAHRGSRHAQRPTPHRRPGRERPAAVARRLRWRAARAEKAAHTSDKVVTRAVFHAPMFALNVLALVNACEPSHPRSTPTERARMCRRGCKGPNRTRTHTHAHMDAARGRVCAEGPHRRSARRCSQTRMDIDTCMHHVSIYYIRACSIDGWRYKESASHSLTCRVLLAHRQRPHAIPRVCKNTHAHPFTYPAFASTHIYIVHHVRWLYPADVPTRASDGNGRIVRAQSHARVHSRQCSRMHAHTHLSLNYIYTYVYMYNAYIYRDTYIYLLYAYIHISRLSYTQLFLRTWTPAHACPQTSEHRHMRAHRRRRCAPRHLYLY